MCTFYRGTIESILTSCITVWYGACNTSCRKSLQRIVRAAEKIVGVSLPSLQDIYSTRLTRKALCIAGDPTHPTHSFWELRNFNSLYVCAVHVAELTIKQTWLDTTTKTLDQFYSSINEVLLFLLLVFFLFLLWDLYFWIFCTCSMFFMFFKFFI